MESNNFISLRSRQELIRINTENILAVVCDSYCSTIHFVDTDIHFTCTKKLKGDRKTNPLTNYLRISRNTLEDLFV